MATSWILIQSMLFFGIGAGVKIIGEDYITTYQPGEQLIYQTTSSGAEEQQIQHSECIQEQHEQQQQECIQQESPSKSQVMASTTLIPLPNMNNIFSSINPNEVRIYLNLKLFEC